VGESIPVGESRMLRERSGAYVLETEDRPYWGKGHLTVDTGDLAV